MAPASEALRPALADQLDYDMFNSLGRGALETRRRGEHGHDHLDQFREDVDLPGRPPTMYPSQAGV